MNIIDIIIIVLLIFSVIAGYKRGVIKEASKVIGNYGIILIAFLLMKPLANVFYNYLPFLSLGMFGITLSALNLLVYQIASFAIIYLILSFILKLVLIATNLVENLVDTIIIFSTLSKILGAIVGLLTGFITVFAILVVASVPLSQYDFYQDSKLNYIILDNAPLLSNVTKPITETSKDIYNLGVEINNDSDKIANSNKYNLKLLNLMLKYDVVDIKTIDNLIEKNKLNDIKNIESVVDKYR